MSEITRGNEIFMALDLNMTGNKVVSGTVSPLTTSQVCWFRLIPVMEEVLLSLSFALLWICKLLIFTHITSNVWPKIYIAQLLKGMEYYPSFILYDKCENAYNSVQKSLLSLSRINEPGNRENLRENLFQILLEPKGYFIRECLKVLLIY